MNKQPIFNVPGIVLALVAVFAAVQGWRQYFASDEQIGLMLSTFAFVPGRMTFAFDPAGVADTFASFTGAGARDEEEVARYFLGDGSIAWWTPLTYSLLHADWTHCGVNSLWLVAFGAPVARRIGAARFVALFAATAVAGAFAHWVAHPYALSPVIGASASVSGAMAAACRFMFQPIRSYVEPGEPLPYQPIMPLKRVFTDRRAVPFLLVWFGVNLVFGLVSAPLGMTSGPVAWEAHVGGFLAGLLLFRCFDPPAPRVVAEPMESA